MATVMKPVNFIFMVHCHQPVGQDEEVIKEAYLKAYLPFIETFEKFPNVKFAARYSGTLYDWFAGNHPEFLEKLKLLVRRGQLEILSGGFYDPILPMISYSDGINQIRMETEFIKKNFLRVPRGIWLTEGIWEPELPKLLADAGMEYTLVEDLSFYSAGISKDEINGYFMTDDHGTVIKVFPMNRDLNEMIPFRAPEVGIDFLKASAKGDTEKLLVFADNGEKYGALPGTDKWTYKDGWLEKFLSLLQQNKDTIITRIFSDHIEGSSPSGRIYLSPTAKNRLSLPINKMVSHETVSSEIKSFGKYEEYRSFLNAGGYYKNYFVRYPEANNIYSKMLYVSHKIEALEKGKILGFSSKERENQIEEIKNQLMKGQCGSCFINESENTLYSVKNREVLYRHLINTELLTDQLNRGKQKFIEGKSIDFDRDGYDEVLVSNDLMNCYFAPSAGGGMFELDHKGKQINLLNVFSRYPEIYHKEVQDRELIYDGYRKMSMLDHFLPVDVAFDQYRESKHKEMGDFISNPYIASIKANAKEVIMKLKRKGSIRYGSENIPLEVTKTIIMFSGQTQLNIEYEILNASDINIETIFGVEFNFLLSSSADDSFYLLDDKMRSESNSYGESRNISSVKLFDASRGISVLLEAGDLNDFWRYPIKTISKNDGVLNEQIQGMSIMLGGKIRITAGNVWKNKMRMTLD